MEENKNVCPCCGRHCDRSAPSCERGGEYARTGVIPERKDRSEHGPHGEHGKFDRHKEHRSILDSERYAAMDEDNKLMVMAC